jgi:ATP-dependent helicase/nuclease subunit B
VSRIRVVPMGVNLIDEVLRILPGEVREYPSALVVFQGRRPGHFLRRALARAAGGAFIPPRVLTLDTFLDMVYSEELGESAEEISPLDAVGMLYELQRGASPRIGGEHYATLESFLSLGRRMYEAFEELQDAGASAVQVRAASTGLQFDNGLLLAALYEQFYANVQAEGKVTRAMKHGICAARSSGLTLERYTTIVFAGLSSMTRVQVSVLKRLLDLPQATCLVEDGPGADDILRSLEQEGGARSPAGPQPTIHLYGTGDTHSQIAGLARIMADMQTPGNALGDETVVVLPSSDALFPLMHWVLPVAGEYNVSLGYPVARTPVFGFLAGVWTLFSSMREGCVYARDYLRCMLHPYLKSIQWNDTPDATRIMFHTIEDFLAREKGWAFFRLEDLEEHRGLLERIGSAVGTPDRPVTAMEVAKHLHDMHEIILRLPMAAGTLGEAARRTIDLLTYVAEEGTAAYHALFKEFALEMISRLDEIRNSRLGGVRVHSPAGGGAMLRQLVEDVVVPFHGTPLKGLQILGWLETRNLQFKRVCILDVSDDVLPGGDTIDPLLPPRMRAALGLPGRRERERAAAHQFAVLLGGAEEVHLFFREGGGKEKSRFIENILWEREQQRQRVGDAGDIRPVDLQLALTHRDPGPIPKPPGVCAVLGQLSYSATMLDTYLTCPSRFYYAHVLGVAERQEVDEEIDRAGIGTFVHEALATYHREILASGPGENLADPDRMDAVVEQLFGKRFGMDLRGQRLLMKMQVQRQLRRYIVEWRKPLIEQERVRIIAVEHRMRYEWDGRALVGKADHVEMRGETTHIVDYKTSADENRYRVRFDRLSVEDREGWTRAIGSLQLPMYSLLYHWTAGAGVETLRPAYVMLGKEAIGPRTEAPLFAVGEDVSALTGQLEAIIRGLLEEITSGEIPFTPTPDLKRNCPQCAFVDFCGTRWVRGWAATGRGQRG